MHTQTPPSAPAPGSANAANAGKLLAEMKGHVGPVTALAFSPDRCLLASASRDGTARIWNVGGSRPGERASISKSGETFRALAFSANSRALALGAGSTSGFAWVYDISEKSPQESFTLRGARGQVTALGFSPDCKLIAGAGEDQTLRIWEPGPTFRGDARALLPGHTKPVGAAAFAPDGLTVATAAQDSTVRLWTIGRIRSSQKAVLTHPGDVLAMCFSADGKTLATACRDGQIRLWDLTAINPTARVTFAGPSGGARVVLMPDAVTVVGVGDGTKVLNWDIRTGKLLREWEVSNVPAMAVALTGDGRYFARGSASGNIEVYRVAEKRA